PGPPRHRTPVISNPFPLLLSISGPAAVCGNRGRPRHPARARVIAAMFFHRMATQPRKGRSVRRTAAQREYVLALNGGDDSGEAGELIGALRFAVDHHLIMDMRAGRAAGAPGKADLPMPGDALSDRHGPGVRLGVAGR